MTEINEGGRAGPAGYTEDDVRLAAEAIQRYDYEHNLSANAVVGNRRCNEPGGGRWSPYFCAGCDERRVKHIGANLAEIAGVIE